MPDYYVSIDVNGDKQEGYVLAKNRGVAVHQFMHHLGLSEEGDEEWSAAKVYHIRMDRLSSYLDEPDPWVAGFKREMIEEDDGSIVANTPYDGSISWAERLLLTPLAIGPRWHAARIIYLTQHIDQMLTPICIDNMCEGDRIYPVPEILDGWHRYYAHLHLGFKRIRCTYGGLVDLLRYLEGKTDEQPEF
jgi:hypothetical protein